MAERVRRRRRRRDEGPPQEPVSARGDGRGPRRLESRKRLDRFERLVYDADDQVLSKFQALAYALRFIDFPGASVDEFSAARNVVLAEYYDGRSKTAALAKRLNLTEERILEVQAWPLTEELRERAEKMWVRLRDPKTVRELIASPLYQDVVFFEVLSLGLTSGDDRVREKALAQIMDRAMPRVTREVMQKILMIAEEDLKLIAETERQVLALAEGSDAEPGPVLEDEAS